MSQFLIDSLSDLIQSESVVPNEIRKVLPLLRGTKGVLPKLTANKSYEVVSQFIRTFCRCSTCDQVPYSDRICIKLDDDTRIEIPQFFDFHLLRHMLLDDETALLGSLSHTRPLDIRGGKRTCLFSETFDGRFIIKSLLPSEVRKWEKNHRAFLWYFMRGVFQTNPTILVPLMGVFIIRRNHPAESGAYVIMRNMSHNLIGSPVFDLKGMGPKRSKKQACISVEKLPDSPPPDVVDVLWDGDLRDLCGHKPIVINADSLALIEDSLVNDTLFLSELDIVDYSMILCCNDIREGFPDGKIIVGIIDYLREYTWEKKIESVVKSINSNLASVGNRISWKPDISAKAHVCNLELANTPTIIRPDLYGRRFRKNISSLFTSSR